MASMGGGYLDPEPLIRLVKSSGLLNKQLQSICTFEGLPKLGVKADLQSRITERIKHYANGNNAQGLERMRQLLKNPNMAPTTGYPRAEAMASGSSSAAHSPAPGLQNPYVNATGGGGYNAGGAAMGYRPIGNPRIEFKSSPYYEIQEQLVPPVVCEVMQHHRHTVKTTLRVNDRPILSRLSLDPTLRIMVFCSMEGVGKQDIAFPHQSEIKVNTGEVKANLRGLKNKPGSTRAVDITKELRLNPAHYVNTVEMTYALTSKKYYLMLYVVKAIPVTDLVKKLEAGKRITEKSVIDEMLNKARDADIVTTASVLSLKCPLSTLRIDLPCRSIACKHNQCFDATSYLQLQEQGPTWLCPICNNPAPFESLAVDEKEPVNPSRSSGVASDSDDDLIEITKSGDSIRMSAPRSFKTPVSMASQQSREPSASSGPPRDPPNTGSTSSKRTISAVIDLTSSGDEDDEPIARPPKRPMTNGYGTPSNVPTYRPAPMPPVNGLPPRPI
ncbi:related to E3 SUMO-protein ligase pli1 [Phialocephala subalpina]|uniref:Related to E3 SUMO-protein ligase pli1 n=1 Tax=Phialocephala subalpina TaxID=576137 RepID=A0A1L7X1S8_9HELO|nr:related to E3 SUMO-protein ligase pli1 [Phialocephala subalpina]